MSVLATFTNNGLLNVQVIIGSRPLSQYFLKTYKFGTRFPEIWQQCAPRRGLLTEYVILK